MNLRPRHFARLASLSSILILTGLATLPSAAQFQRARGNPFQEPQATMHTPHERSYHVRHLKLIFDIDAANHAAKGDVTEYLTALKDGLADVTLDAGANLKINSVTLNGTDVPFKHEGEVLTITPATPLNAKKEVAVEIRYEMPGGRTGGGANGAGGFTWIDPRPTDPTRVTGFWTQGETDTNHKWVPCYDFPNDKCTSETHTTVPDTWRVIGNGAESPVTVNAEKHTKTYHWVMKQPHSTYLLSLAGGEMDVQKGSWAGIPLYYAVPKGMGDMIPSTFGNTPDMLEFFSKRFGVKYPWPKYAQTVAFDFPGGMENVSATTLGSPGGVMADARSGHFPAASLTSHELSHQWFGDLVTCSDWGDTWLNEGFATFCQMIYTEHLLGKDAYEQDRMNNLRQYIGETRRYNRATSTKMYSGPDVMFDAHSYQRGGLILHMLRTQLGDDLFYKGLAHYLKSHAYQPVGTPDLIKSLSEVAGRDLTPFFDQWVFKPGHPVVEWSWSYDETNKYTVLKLKQTQDTKDGTPVYSLPLKIATILPVSGKKGQSPVQFTTVTFDKVEQEVRLPGAVKPDSVIIDPNHDLMMETKAGIPQESELVAQLKYAPSYQERSRAATALARSDKGKDDATIQMLSDAVTAETSDIAATGMLNSLAEAKKETLRPLFRAQANAHQPGRRAAALTALGTLPANPEDTALLRKVAISDTEPYSAVEGALRGLSRLDLAANLDVLQHQVGVKSSRDRLARSVVESISDAKLEAGVPLLIQAAGPSHSGFLRYTAIRAIGTLAPDSTDVHSTLVTACKDDSSPFLQSAAIRALKDRKDKAALDTLRDVAANAKSQDVRAEAKDAVDNMSDTSSR